MAVFDSGKAKVLMPRQIADGIITRTQTLSTVAKLNGGIPMTFGDVDIITFDNFPRAEFVDEGAEKAPTSGEFGYVTAKPHKAQVTMRFNEEVQWADEDYQLDVLNQLAQKGSEALSRALDLGLYHRVNPLTGAVIDAWTNYLTSTTKSVEIGTTEMDQAIRQAAGLLINDNVAPITPTGLALAPSAVWALGSLQTKNADGSPSGTPRYPQIGLGVDIDNFMGLPAAAGNTVAGKPEATAATNVEGIVGDFVDGIRWGIQRSLPLEIIRFGDPDGQGDLKRRNQIALRLEILYAWYVFSDKFATIKTKAGA